MADGKPPTATDLLRSLAELERQGARLLHETPMALPTPVILTLVRAAEARADTFEAMAQERGRGLAMVDLPGAPIRASESSPAETLEREEIQARLIDAIEQRDRCVRQIRGMRPPMSPRDFARCLLEMVEKERPV